MKKFLLGLIIFIFSIFLVACGNGAVPTNPVDKITLKLSDTKMLSDCSIKFLSDESMRASYYVTPSGFEMEKLAEKGYKMQITVTYEVYYKKDWKLGFGYKGSPRYEISIVNSKGMGVMDEDLTTSTTSVKRTFSYTGYVVDIKNMNLVLTFSTDNIQNIIYFKNMKVDYQCYK